MAKVIWTNHLYERIKQRGLDPRLVDQAVRFPDRVEDSSTTNSKKHIKRIDRYEIVAAVKRQGGDWVITSAWWNEIYGSSKSTQKRYSRNRFFLEVWIDRALIALEKWIRGNK